MPRPVADDARRIEVCQLPPPSGRIGLQWANIASATLDRDGDVVKVRYRWRTQQGEPWRETAQEIRLAYVGCHFGGRQTFFVCFGCSRRARKLFDAGDGRFVCRQCGQLVAQSQSQGSSIRRLRRAFKIRRYLGGNGNISEPFPVRPKGMRRRIYECLRNEVTQLEAVPIEAWLGSGTHNVRLGIRRGTAGAKKRQWWPGRNGWSG